MLKVNYAGIVIYLTQHSNLAPCSQLKATRSAILVLQAAVVAKLHFQNYKVMLTLIRTEHSPKHNMKRNIVVNTLRWNGEVRCISIKLWKKASCDWQITSGPTYSLETDCLRNQDHGVVRSEHKGIFGERPAIWGGGVVFWLLGLSSGMGWRWSASWPLELFSCNNLFCFLYATHQNQREVQHPLLFYSHFLNPSNPPPPRPIHVLHFSILLHRQMGGGGRQLHQ